MQVIYVDFLNFKSYIFGGFMREDVCRARPEKFVRFLLAATSNHVQVMLGWTKTGKKLLRRKAKYKSIEDKANWVFMLLRLEAVG